MNRTYTLFYLSLLITVSSSAMTPTEEQKDLISALHHSKELQTALYAAHKQADLLARDHAHTTASANLMQELASAIRRINPQKDIQPLIEDIVYVEKIGNLLNLYRQIILKECEHALKSSYFQSMPLFENMPKEQRIKLLNDTNVPLHTPEQLKELASHTVLVKEAVKQADNETKSLEKITITMLRQTLAIIYSYLDTNFRELNTTIPEEREYKESKNENPIAELERTNNNYFILQASQQEIAFFKALKEKLLHEFDYFSIAQLPSPFPPDYSESAAQKHRALLSATTANFARAQKAATAEITAALSILESAANINTTEMIHEKLLLIRPSIIHCQQQYSSLQTLHQQLTIPQRSPLATNAFLSFLNRAKQNLGSYLKKLEQKEKELSAQLPNVHYSHDDIQKFMQEYKNPEKFRQYIQQRHCISPTAAPSSSLPSSFTVSSAPLESYSSAALCGKELEIFPISQALTIAKTYKIHPYLKIKKMTWLSSNKGPALSHLFLLGHGNKILPLAGKNKKNLKKTLTPQARISLACNKGDFTLEFESSNNPLSLWHTPDNMCYVMDEGKDTENVYLLDRAIGAIQEPSSGNASPAPHTHEAEIKP